MNNISNLVAIATLSFGMSAVCQESTSAPSPLKSRADGQTEIRNVLSKLQTSPNSALLHNQLAVLYGATGNLVGFEREINTAIKLAPKDPINYFQAFLVYGRHGLEEKQVAMLERAIRSDSQNPVFRFERARFYEAKGDHARAKRDYLHAKQLVVIATERGDQGVSDHVLRASRVVEGTYYDSYNNAYSVENLKVGIEKGLAGISE